MSPPRVAIIGGGVSGLATAYYLGQRGVFSVLIEKSHRLGGLIQTDVVAGCHLEAGPDSYISTKPAVTDLAGEIEGLRGQIMSSNDAQRRVFIVRSGKLVPLPRGMTMMVPGQLGPALRSELFGLATKARFVTERFSRPYQRGGDISVGELVVSHFGDEVLEYIADPLLAGVYGGDARHLSARSVLPRFVGYEQRFGSLIKGVQQEQQAAPKTGLFVSFRDGMQSLTDALTHAIAGTTQVTHGEATTVQRTPTGWRLTVAADQVEADHVVLACPAYTCARLLEKTAPTLSSELASIPYSSALLVTLVYPSEEVRHPLDGFGFLVPKKERRAVAAVTWINTKFPSRIAPGLIAIRAFIVSGEALQLANAPDPELVDLVRQDSARLMNLHAAPQHAFVYRWPDSMPQYIVGHEARQAKITNLTAELPGLHLVSNAYDGVGIPDCIRLAKQTAVQISTN